MGTPEDGDGFYDGDGRLEYLAQAKQELDEAIRRDRAVRALWKLAWRTPYLSRGQRARAYRRLGLELPADPPMPAKKAEPSTAHVRSSNEVWKGGAEALDPGDYAMHQAAVWIFGMTVIIVGSALLLVESGPSAKEQAEATGYVLETPAELEKRGLCPTVLRAEAMLVGAGFSSGSSQASAGQLWDAAERARRYGIECVAPPLGPESKNYLVPTSEGTQVLVTVATITGFSAVSPCARLGELEDQRRAAEPDDPSLPALTEQVRLQTWVADQTGQVCI